MAVNSATILLTKSNKTLLLKKTYGKLGWTTPGGRIDDNETSFMAATRELSEETGISLSMADIEDMATFVYIDTEIYIILLLIDEDDLYVELSYEHSDYAWVHLDDLFLYDLEDYTRFSFKQAATLEYISF